MSSISSLILNCFEVLLNITIQGWGIPSLGVLTVFWAPVCSTLVLFLFMNVVPLFNSYLSPALDRDRLSPLSFIFFTGTFYLRILLVFLASANLILSILAHSLVISYSRYGLSFTRDLCSLHFFGPAQNFTFVLDEFVSFFILLNSFVIFCCLIFIALNKTYTEPSSIIYRSQLLLLTQFFANLAFAATDMLGFYVFYEAILIPVMNLIEFQNMISAEIFMFFITLGISYFFIARLLMATWKNLLIKLKYCSIIYDIIANLNYKMTGIKIQLHPAAIWRRPFPPIFYQMSPSLILTGSLVEFQNMISAEIFMFFITLGISYFFIARLLMATWKNLLIKLKYCSIIYDIIANLNYKMAGIKIQLHPAAIWRRPFPPIFYQINAILVTAESSATSRHVFFTRILMFFIVLAAIYSFILVLIKFAQIVLPFVKTRLLRFLDLTFFDRDEELDPTQANKVFREFHIVGKEEAYFLDIQMGRYYSLTIIDTRYRKTRNFFLVFTRFQHLYSHSSFTSRLLLPLRVVKDHTIKEHLDLKTTKSLLYEEWLRRKSRRLILELKEIETELLLTRSQAGFDIDTRCEFVSPYFEPHPTEEEQKKNFEFLVILFYFLLFYILPWFYFKGKRNSNSGLQLHPKLLQLRHYKDALHAEGLSYRDRFFMVLLSGFILGDPKLDLFEHLWKEFEKGTHLNWAGFRRKKALVEFRHYQSARMYERIVRTNAALYLEEALRQSFYKPIYYSNPFKYQDKRILRVQTNLFFKKRFHHEFYNINFRPVLQAYSHRFMTALREHPVAVRAKRRVGALQLEESFFLRKYQRRRLAERQILNILAAQRKKDRHYRVAQLRRQKKKLPFNRVRITPYTNFKNVNFDFFFNFYPKKRFKKRRYRYLDKRILRHVNAVTDYMHFRQSHYKHSAEKLEEIFLKHSVPFRFSFFIPTPRLLTFAHFIDYHNKVVSLHSFTADKKLDFYAKLNALTPSALFYQPNGLFTNFYDRFNLYKFRDRTKLNALLNIYGRGFGIYGFYPWWHNGKLRFLDFYSPYTQYDKPDFFTTKISPLKFYSVFELFFGPISREDYHYDESSDFFSYHSEKNRLADFNWGYAFLGDVFDDESVIDSAAFFQYLEFDLVPDFNNMDIDFLLACTTKILYLDPLDGVVPVLVKPKVRSRKWYYRRYPNRFDEVTLPKGLLPTFSFVYPNLMNSTIYFYGPHTPKSRQFINLKSAKFNNVGMRDRLKLWSLLNFYWPSHFNNTYSILQVPSIDIEGLPVFFLNFLNWDYQALFQKRFFDQDSLKSYFTFGPLNSRDYFYLKNVPNTYSSRVLFRKLYRRYRRPFLLSRYTPLNILNNYFFLHPTTEKRPIDAQHILQFISHVYENIVFRPVYRGLRWKRRYSLRQWRLLKLTNRNFMDPYLFNKLASLYSQELDFALFSNSLQRWAHRYGHFHFDYTGTFYEPRTNLLFLTQRLAPFTKSVSTVHAPGMYNLPDSYFLYVKDFEKNDHFYLLYATKFTDFRSLNSVLPDSFAIFLYNPFYRFFQRDTSNENFNKSSSSSFIIPFHTRIIEFLQYLNPFRRKLFLGFSDKHSKLDYPYAFTNLLNKRDPWYLSYYYSVYLKNATDAAANKNYYRLFNDVTFFIRRIMPFPFLYINRPVYPVIGRWDPNELIETFFPLEPDIFADPNHAVQQGLKFWNDSIYQYTRMGYWNFAAFAARQVAFSPHAQVYFNLRPRERAQLLRFSNWAFFRWGIIERENLRSSGVIDLIDRFTPYELMSRYFLSVMSASLTMPSRHFNSFTFDDPYYEIFLNPNLDYYHRVNIPLLSDDYDEHDYAAGSTGRKIGWVISLPYFEQVEAASNQLFYAIFPLNYSARIPFYRQSIHYNFYTAPYMHAANLMVLAQSLNSITYKFPYPYEPFGYNFSSGLLETFPLPPSLAGIRTLYTKDNLGVQILSRVKPYVLNKKLIKKFYPERVNPNYTPLGYWVQRIGRADNLFDNKNRYSSRIIESNSNQNDNDLFLNFFYLYPAFLHKSVNNTDITFEDLIAKVESHYSFIWGNVIKAKFHDIDDESQFLFNAIDDDDTDQLQSWENLLNYYGLSINWFFRRRNNSFFFTNHSFFVPHHLGEIKVLPILTFNDRRRQFDTRLLLKQNLFYRDLWNENFDLFKLKRLNTLAYLDYLADIGLLNDSHYNDLNLQPYYNANFKFPLLSTVADLSMLYELPIMPVPLSDNILCYPNLRLHGDHLKELKLSSKNKSIQKEKVLDLTRLFPYDSFFFGVLASGKEYPRYSIPRFAHYYYLVTNKKKYIYKMLRPHAFDWARHYPNCLVTKSPHQTEADFLQTLIYFPRYTLLRRPEGAAGHLVDVLQFNPRGLIPYLFKYSPYPYFQLITTPLLNAVDLNKIILTNNYEATKFFETSLDLLQNNFLSLLLFPHDLQAGIFDVNHVIFNARLNKIPVRAQLPIMLYLHLYNNVKVNPSFTDYSKNLLSFYNNLIGERNFFSDLPDGDLTDVFKEKISEEILKAKIKDDDRILNVTATEPDVYEPLWDHNFYKLREFRPSDSRRFWPNDLGMTRRILKRIANYRVYAPLDNYSYSDSLNIKVRYEQNKKLYFALEKIFTFDKFDDFKYAFESLILSNENLNINTRLALRRLFLRVTPEIFYIDSQFVANIITKMKNLLLNDLTGCTRYDFKDEYYKVVADKLLSFYSSNNFYANHPFSNLNLKNYTQVKPTVTQLPVQDLLLARRLAYRDAVYYLNSIVIFGIRYLGFTKSSLKCTEDFINTFAFSISNNPSKLEFPDLPTDRLGLFLVKIFVFKFMEYYKKTYKKIQVDLLKFSYFQALNSSDAFLPPLWSSDMYYKIGHPYLINRVTLPDLFEKLKHKDNTYSSPYTFMKPITEVFFDLAPNANISVLQHFDYNNRFKILLQTYNDYAESTRKQIIHHLANNDLESAYSAYLNCYVPLLTKPVALTFTQFSNDAVFQYFLTKSVLTQYYYDVANKRIDDKTLFIPKFIMLNYLKNFMLDSNFIHLFINEANSYINQASIINFFVNLEDQHFLNHLHKLSTLLDNSNQEFWSAYVLPSQIGPRLANYKFDYESVKDLFWKLRHFTRYPYQHRRAYDIGGIINYRRFLSDPILNKFLGGLDISYINKNLSNAHPIMEHFYKILRTRILTDRKFKSIKAIEFEERKDRFYSIDDLLYLLKKKIGNSYLTFITDEHNEKKKLLRWFMSSPERQNFLMDLTDYHLFRYFLNSGRLNDPNFKEDIDLYTIPMHVWYRNNIKRKVPLHYLPNNSEFLFDQNIFLRNVVSPSLDIYKDIQNYYYKRAFSMLTEDEFLSYQLTRQRSELLNHTIPPGLIKIDFYSKQNKNEDLLPNSLNYCFQLYKNSFEQLQTGSNTNILLGLPVSTFKTKLSDVLTESSKYKLNYKLFDKHLKEVYLNKFHRLPIRYTDVLSKRSASFKNNWRPSNKRLKIFLNRRKNLFFRNKNRISYSPYKWSWYDELRAMVGLTTPRRVRYSDFRTLRELTSYELEQLGLHYLMDYYPYVRMWYLSTHPKEYQNLMSYYTSDPTLPTIYEFDISLQYQDFSDLPFLAHYHIFIREPFYANPFWASVFNSTAELAEVSLAYSILFIAVCFFNYVVPKIITIVTKFTIQIAKKCMAYFTK